jgi:hypothetical protein
MHVQAASARLDKWFANQSRNAPLDETFTRDVAIIRHVTDFETGERRAVCFGRERLSHQTASSFGQRSKHLLAEVLIPQHYLTFVQSYEVTHDSQGRSWRQSSLRIRVFDPSDGYKLKLGLIFYSERDCLPKNMLNAKRSSCALNRGTNPSQELADGSRLATVISREQVLQGEKAERTQAELEGHEMSAKKLKTLQGKEIATA